MENILSFEGVRKLLLYAILYAHSEDCKIIFVPTTRLNLVGNDVRFSSLAYLFKVQLYLVFCVLDLLVFFIFKLIRKYNSWTVVFNSLTSALNY